MKCVYSFLILTTKFIDEVDWNGKNWATSCTFSGFSKSTELEKIIAGQVLSIMKVALFYGIEENNISSIKHSNFDILHYRTNVTNIVLKTPSALTILGPQIKTTKTVFSRLVQVFNAPRRHFHEGNLV